MTSAAELLLEEQLRQAGIPFEREYAFAKELGRRWRFDFAFPEKRWYVLQLSAQTYQSRSTREKVAVEVEGGAFTGGHRRGTRADLDCEKANAAALMGWTVLRFTPAMVEDGRALAVIRQALGFSEVAA